MSERRNDGGNRRATPARSLLALIALCGLVGAGCGGETDSKGELAPTAGFDGRTITVGVNSALTGPLAVVGQPLTAGNEVWFEYVNDRRGGIAGRYPVEIDKADNRYEPANAVQQYNRQEDEVVIFAQLQGTPVTTAVLPQLKADNYVASPASLDSLWVRQQQLAPLAAPYQIEAINGMDYYMRTEGDQDSVVCTMIQDDVAGEAGQEGVEFAGGQLGFEVAETARFRVGDQDFTAQIGQLENAGCEAVFIAAAPVDAGNILGTAAQAGFAPRWIGWGPVWFDTLLDSPLSSYLQQRLWVVAEGPEWGDRSVPGMARMLDRIERYKPNQHPSFYFTFGYVQGLLVTDILERAVERGDLSPEGIVEAMNSLDTVSFEGLAGDWQYGPPEDRVPARENTVFRPDPSAPFGLRALEVNFASEAAEAYEFEAE